MSTTFARSPMLRETACPTCGRYGHYSSCRTRQCGKLVEFIDSRFADPEKAAFFREKLNEMAKNQRTAIKVAEDGE